MANFPVLCKGHEGATYSLQSLQGQEIAVDFYSGHHPRDNEQGHVDLGRGANHGSFTSRLGVMKFFYFGPSRADQEW